MKHVLHITGMTIFPGRLGMLTTRAAGFVWRQTCRFMKLSGREAGPLRRPASHGSTDAETVVRPNTIPIADTVKSRKIVTPNITGTVVLIAAAGVFTFAGNPCAATSVPRVVFGQTSPLSYELTPPVRKAVRKGLLWLARRQATDGSYGRGNQVAITALAGIAFMAGGNLPGQGPYGANEARALHYVLSQCRQSGLIAGADDGEPMYGQGFATLFLAEIYGESHAPELRQKLQRAVRLIVQTQNNQGGWRYQPMPMDGDISVTICQVMALRAARQAGIAVPRRTIQKAIGFVRRLQNPDGGFSYMLNMRGSDFPRTAAGVALLFYAGVYRGRVIDSAMAYMLNCLPGNPQNNQGNFFYGNYYGVQAMFLAGGRWWAKWWPAIRTVLLARQSADGNWIGGAGASYATAMALIILQVPDRLLPILQK